MTDKYFLEYYKNKLEALEIEKKLIASPYERINQDLRIASAQGLKDMCEGKSSGQIMDDYTKALEKSRKEMESLR